MKRRKAEGRRKRIRVREKSRKEGKKGGGEGGFIYSSNI